MHVLRRKEPADHALITYLPAGGVTLVSVAVPGVHFAWRVLSGTVALVAIIRVLRRPAHDWSYRNWSKLAWVLAILYLAPDLAGYPIPIGTVAAICRTTRHQKAPPATDQLPAHPGSPDWPWPWGTK